MTRMNKLLKPLANLPRSLKAFFLICVDGVIIVISLILAFAVRFDPSSLIQHYQSQSEGAWIFVGMQLLALLIMMFLIITIPLFHIKWD